jgi:hypothetical protein
MSFNLATILTETTLAAVHGRAAEGAFRQDTEIRPARRLGINVPALTERGELYIGG